MPLSTAWLALALGALPFNPGSTGVGAPAVWDPEGTLFAPGGDEVDDGVETPEGSPGGAIAEGLLYSADLSDRELLRRFAENLPSVGSISVGFAEAGRLINGVQMPPGSSWSVVAPDNAWGAQETIDAVVAVANAVRAQCSAAGPLRVNHIGKKDGGYLRPHQSHQSGRDVDLGFFYKDGLDPGAASKNRLKAMDLAANWALLRTLATTTDVQVVLVDYRVQKVLYDYALRLGEDKGFLDSLFHAGREALVQHARGHRDHFHVRFFAPRAQELGRRIQPLLASKLAENLIIHKVKQGDTLGRIASLYGSTVKLVQKANGLTGTFLKTGRTLNVPLRGPCTNCPQPPPLIVPARRLAPPPVDSMTGASGSR